MANNRTIDNNIPEMESRESFTIIPNNYIWSYEEGEVSLVKGLNSKILIVISFIQAQSNIYGESFFTLEYLVTRCGYKPSKVKGKSNEQFKECLLQLVEVGLLKDIDNTVKNCKASSLIICRLNLPKVESQFFKLNYSTVEEILSIEEGDKTTLLNIYSYILARLHRRKGNERRKDGTSGNPIYKDGGHAECFYDSQENIANDLGINKNTFIKHIKILAENGLIYYSNLGKAFSKEKGCYNMSNVYTIDKDELEQALIDCAYKAMKNDINILGEKRTNESFKQNGIKAQIKLREQLGKDITSLESKLEDTVEESIPLTKKEMRYIAKAREDFKEGSKDNNKSNKQSNQEQCEEVDYTEEEYLKIIDDVDFENNEDDDMFNELDDLF